MLRSRDEQRAQLSACTETAPLSWQHPHRGVPSPLPALQARDELPRVGINPQTAPWMGQRHGTISSFLSPLNQTFSAQMWGPAAPTPHMGSVLLPGLPPASLLAGRLLGCTNASAPKRALGTEKQGFLNKPEMLSLKISDSQLQCHCIAHTATAALGIFISFALLLLLLCFIPRHPLSSHALGWAAASAWSPLLHLCLSTRL